MSTQNKKKPLWPKLLTIGSVLLVVVIAVSLLPRGFPTDTSIIGQGSNVVVLAYDLNYVQSAETALAMNLVREEFQYRVEFLVVKVGSPEGVAFFNSHGLQPLALAFFAGNGKKLQVIYSPQDEKSLRGNLNRIFQY